MMFCGDPQSTHADASTQDFSEQTDGTVPLSLWCITSTQLNEQHGVCMESSTQSSSLFNQEHTLQAPKEEMYLPIQQTAICNRPACKMFWDNGGAELVGVTNQ